MFICTGCQKEYENQTKFCCECGGKVEEKIEVAPTVYTCSQCGKEYDGNTKFCSECGGKVVSQSVPVQPVTVKIASIQPVPVQPVTAKIASIQPVQVVRPITGSSFRKQDFFSICYFNKQRRTWYAN